jgi:hypothetical protein
MPAPQAKAGVAERAKMGKSNKIARIHLSIF